MNEKAPWLPTLVILILVISGVILVALGVSGSDVTLIKFDTFEIKTRDSGIILISLALLFFIVGLVYSAKTGKPIFKAWAPKFPSFPRIPFPGV